MCPCTFSNPSIETRKSNKVGSLPSKRLPILRCLGALTPSAMKFHYWFTYDEKILSVSIHNRLKDEQLIQL